MKHRFVFVLFAALFALASSPAAFADTLSFTLNNPSQAVAPGSTASFLGTLTAARTNTGVEYLNGDAFTLSPAGFVLDDIPFFTTFPSFLTAGQSVTGVLFTITAPLTPATFSGTFSILGGPTPSTYGVLASQNFTTSTASTVTPEPSTSALLATGLLGVWLLARRSAFMKNLSEANTPS